VPRLPVDGRKVIEHRITFGSAERRYMDTLVGSIAFKNHMSPIVDTIKDVSALAFLYVVLNSLFPQWKDGLDLETLDSTNSDGWRDYFEAQNIAGVAVGVGVGVATGGLGWIPAIIGGLLGTIAVEGSEELYEDAQGIKRSLQGAYGTQMAMLSLRLIAKDQGYI